MLSVSRRTFADINGNIKNGTADASHKFGLCEWRCLEVQAPHHAIRAHALIVLYELYAVAQDGCNGVVEVSLGEALKEVSTRIAKDFWLYYQCAWNGGFDYVDHLFTCYMQEAGYFADQASVFIVYVGVKQ